MAGSVNSPVNDSPPQRPHHLSLRRRFVFLLLAHFTLALPGLWVPYYNIDELSNAIYAKFILDGTLSLRDFVGNTYLLTHYLYALLGYFFGFDSLAPVHMTHALWKAFTILALFWAGRELADEKVGWWSAVFYTFGSLCFMSKDFHTPSAESFSLLPAALCAGFFFRALNRSCFFSMLAAGALAGVAALFKAPMGVLIVALLLTILVRRQSVWKNAFVCLLAFVGVLFLQAAFVSPFGEGFAVFWAKVSETHDVYIQSYDGLSLLYWLLKFFIRTGIVAMGLFTVTLFAIQSGRVLFRMRKKTRVYWQKIFFLCVLLVMLWYVVSLGKRVFFHYYVFMLVPLCLMAGAGIKIFDSRLIAFLKHKSPESTPFFFTRFVREHIWIFLFLPTIAFSIEGAFNYTTLPLDVSSGIQYIRSQTSDADRIYVWGNIPQLYFFGDRQPATVYFWSDTLAGTSPGSPAMEYVRATGKKLTLSEKLIKDFQARVFQEKDITSLFEESQLYGIQESELFTLEELVQKIDQPYWRKVFRDFFANPPELFIDTSPTNYRGFGHYPIQRYELLKRFVQDNYRVEAVVDRMVFYRLNRS